MNYIYFGVNDLYLPATAAALHLAHLSTASPPTQEELRSLPYCHGAEKEDEGQLIRAGRDKQGNHIYVTSVKGHPDVIVRAVESLLGVYQISLNEVKVIPCVPENPQITVLCRMLSFIGLQKAADRLIWQVARNRHADLAGLSAGAVSS
ncbi:MAG: DUF3189 family protein [Bacillota bacterium]|nr:DUF3189 family protein [Bacillota bacterium]MDW7684129.1 DUF3189 family protein [Bacillota bacterium]